MKTVCCRLPYTLTALIFITATLLFTSGCGKSGGGYEHGRISGSDAGIRVMSYNIRYDNPADGVNSWPNRRQDLINLISFYQPDFLGTQEAMIHQLAFIDSALVQMKWIGLSRDSSRTEGEFSALFYNSDSFELVAGSDSTVWLSPTPAQAAKAWDADLPRIVTWGEFRRKADGRHFYVFNTHFDHRGDTARAESAKLIRRLIRENAGEKPVILTGDFNATPDSRPYEILTEGNMLRDTYTLSRSFHVGPSFTFEGFEVQSEIAPRRIDYIFINAEADVKKHAIISSFKGNFYPSDHLPVYAEIELQK